MGVGSLAALILAAFIAVGAPRAAEARKAAPAPVEEALSGGFAHKGLAYPRGFVLDEATGYYYVANLNGRQLSKQNRGFVTRLNPDGSMDQLKFLQGGVAGITLHAPKGLLIDGDKLYVSDIDHIVVADKSTGAFIANIDLAPHGAQYLADMVKSPRGRVLVCDTIGGVIYAIDPAAANAVTVFAKAKELESPSAIVYAPKLEKFLVTLANGHVGTVDQAGKVNPKFAAIGFKSLVGMDLDADGNLYVASFTRGRVFQIADFGRGAKRELTPKLDSPGSLFLDHRNRKLLVPITLKHRLLALEY